MTNNKLINKLFKLPLPKLTPEVRREIVEGHITPLLKKDVNLLITDSLMQKERGYTKLPSGGYLVAMHNKMSEVTIDMINWWFWWHPQADERYQVWFPNEHLGITVREKELYRGEYKGKLPLPSTHYPKERVGRMKAQLSIEFVEPKSFGVKEDLMDQHDIGIAICAHVGILKGLIYHTEMVHLLKKEDDGLTIISRFWMGENLPHVLQKFIFTDEQARGMAEHCYLEYKRLGEILPKLYNAYR